MREKHREKKENLEAIGRFRRDVREKQKLGGGGEVEFDGKKGLNIDGYLQERRKKKENVLNLVREQHEKHKQAKKQKAAQQGKKKKRAGKNARAFKRQKRN